MPRLALYKAFVDQHAEMIGNFRVRMLGRIEIEASGGPHLDPRAV